MGHGLCLSFPVAFIFTTSAYVDEICPRVDEQNWADPTVGSCKSGVCPVELGPTECVNRKCICTTGSCPYPSKPLPFQKRYCVVRALGQFCEQDETACWSAGVLRTICDRGFCMCKRGYEYDASTGQCFALVVPPNHSKVHREQLSMMDIKENHGTESVTFNVALLLLGVTLAGTIINGLILIRCRLTGLYHQNNGYWQFSSNAAVVAIQRVSLGSG
eukprot:gnl/MRDRNA2_/MRDRNA2_224769_c0_seq1.p1 gnl/MRDRNA2_/MRDRNA2_224769_c0~~gnl/MRDRNA2_/MRDRNA2_224769_c0_seq1.p1  ORF type:complete len:217 (-),score=15.59 gnl/MRDRNA2_/MRDRNA2_224769_c0_seq1:65-715(-)